MRGLPMPQVPSNDAGNVKGLVHSHRFPGANTAVPTANQDQAQFEFAKRFLQDKQTNRRYLRDFPGGERSQGARPH